MFMILSLVFGQGGCSYLDSSLKQAGLSRRFSEKPSQKLYKHMLAFAASKFANRLKPLLVVGLRRMAILVVLLQILTLFGHVNDPLRWLYLQ